MAVTSELQQIILAGRETLGIEFKRSMSWADRATQGKVVRTALAFANNRDGGIVVFGVEIQDGSPIHQAVGMSDPDFASFTQDSVISTVNTHAVPHIDLTVDHLSIQDRKFVAISIREFSDYPVICSKDLVVEKPVVIRGRLYTRSRRMAESTEVQSPEDMRAIVDLATAKGLERYHRLRAIEAQFAGPPAADKFREQLGDLGR